MKAEAAEWRNYAGPGCKGNYTVSSVAVMNQCTTYILLGQSSVWSNQTNDTAFETHHYSSSDDCNGKSDFGSTFIVGQCQESEAVGPYPATSNMYAWGKAPAPPTSTCETKGFCGVAYQAC